MARRRLLSRSILSAILHSPPRSAQALLPAAASLAVAAPECTSTLSRARSEWPSGTQLAHYAKQAGKGKGKGKGAAAASAEQADEEPAVEFSLEEPAAAMQHTIERFQHELSGVRTGRANPGLIESLVVDFQGDRMPLKACGAVIVRGSQTLAVAVYDPSMAPDVIKAIKASPLSLNPQSVGGEVLVQVPKMSKDTIEKMVKLVHMEAEAAKVGGSQGSRSACRRRCWAAVPGGRVGSGGAREGLAHAVAPGWGVGGWVCGGGGGWHVGEQCRAGAHTAPHPPPAAAAAGLAGQHPARSAEGHRCGQEGVQQQRRAQGGGEECTGPDRQVHRRGGAAKIDQGQGAERARELS
jgi:ribosome recycling factor